MKRSIALLMSCLLIVSAFASCGKDSSSSNTEATTSANTSETATDTSEETAEASTAASTGEEKTSEKTTEKTTTSAKTVKVPDKETTTEAKAVTTTAETTADAKTTTKKTTSPVTTGRREPVTEDTSRYKGGDVTGSWVIEEDEITASLIFNPGGKGDISVDVSYMFSFRDGKVYFFDDEDESITYDFSGSKLSILYEGEKMFVFDKKSGGSGTLDGTYTISEGEQWASALTGGAANVDRSNTLITIDGGKTVISASDAFSYSVSGNKLTIESASYNMDDEGTFYYSVDGNTLTMLADDGVETVLKREK